MSALIILVLQEQGFFTQLGNRIQEGGTFSMTLILICFGLMLFLIGRAVVKLKATHPVFKKAISLVNQIALLALVIGVFNQLLSLIEVFDSVDVVGEIEPGLLAAGLKKTFLPGVFGGFAFILGRLSTFILTWLRTEDQQCVKPMKDN
ncbi:MAG: hypothetical protein V7767_02155 [Leeuwenhoekiella sp.]